MLLVSISIHCDIKLHMYSIYTVKYVYMIVQCILSHYVQYICMYVGTYAYITLDNISHLNIHLYADRSIMR